MTSEYKWNYNLSTWANNAAKFAHEAAQRREEAATQLTIESLLLSGTDEPFYLEDGETLLWIRDNGDGTATVRTRDANGVEDVIDADINR